MKPRYMSTFTTVALSTSMGVFIILAIDSWMWQATVCFATLAVLEAVAQVSYNSTLTTVALSAAMGAFIILAINSWMWQATVFFAAVAVFETVALVIFRYCCHKGFYDQEK